MTITILENGRLFDGFNDRLVDPCHVLVEDDRIREVAFTPISIENAAGVRSIEHGSDLDEETAKIIAAAGSFVVPTPVVADTALRHGTAMGLKAANLAKLAVITEKMYPSIETCARQGVKLGFGTDLPGNFGERQNEEFRLRAAVQASIDVLRSATSVNAALLGLDDEIGCVRAGAYADLLVVTGDPTRDISLLAEPEACISLIMARGSLVKNMLSP
jgi:imidazolonepropionase-like amidohydrolase